MSSVGESKEPQSNLEGLKRAIDNANSELAKTSAHADKLAITRTVTQTLASQIPLEPHAGLQESLQQLHHNLRALKDSSRLATPHTAPPSALETSIDTRIADLMQWRTELRGVNTPENAKVTEALMFFEQAKKQMDQARRTSPKILSTAHEIQALQSEIEGETAYAAAMQLKSARISAESKLAPVTIVAPPPRMAAPPPAILDCRTINSFADLHGAIMQAIQHNPHFLEQVTGINIQNSPMLKRLPVGMLQQELGAFAFHFYAQFPAATERILSLLITALSESNDPIYAPIGARAQALNTPPNSYYALCKAWDEAIMQKINDALQQLHTAPEAVRSKKIKEIADCVLSLPLSSHMEKIAHIGASIASAGSERNEFFLALIHAYQHDSQHHFRSIGMMAENIYMNMRAVGITADSFEALQAALHILTIAYKIDSIQTKLLAAQQLPPWFAPAATAQIESEKNELEAIENRLLSKKIEVMRLQKSLTSPSLQFDHFTVTAITVNQAVSGSLKEMHRTLRINLQTNQASPTALLRRREVRDEEDFRAALRREIPIYDILYEGETEVHIIGIADKPFLVGTMHPHPGRWGMLQTLYTSDLFDAIRHHEITDIHDKIDTVAALGFGVQHAHNKNVLLRDIKEENAVVKKVQRNPSERARPVTANFDFDRAIRLTESTVIDSYGTDVVSAPELAQPVRGIDAAKKTDIWAFGLMVLGVMDFDLSQVYYAPIGSYLLQNEISSKTSEAIAQLQAAFRKKYPHEIRQGEPGYEQYAITKLIVFECLNPNPTERITIDAFLEKVARINGQTDAKTGRGDIAALRGSLPQPNWPAAITPTAAVTPKAPQTP